MEDDVEEMEQDPLSFHCEVCKTSFLTKRRLEYHVETRHSMTKFQCELCASFFTTKYGVKYHIEAIHLQLRPYKCSCCPSEFFTAQRLQKHYTIHEKPKPFACTICSDVAFTSETRLQGHMKSNHNVVLKPYQCKVCEAAFPNKWRMKSHVDAVHKKIRPYQCVTCSHGFSTKSHLKRHIIRIHETPGPFVCKLCSSSFSKDSYLLQHMKKNHGLLKPYKCPECPAAFSKKERLQRHFKMSHEKLQSFGCKLCSASFSMEKGLQTHMKHIHGILKPFICSQCPATFPQSYPLRRHLEAAHGKPRPFVCKFCSATFSKNSRMLSHTKSVHGVLKPFKCNLCSASFDSNQRLQRHSTVHREPIKCDFCSMKFATQGNLLHHVQYGHGKFRPYTCTKCSASFFYKYKLREHCKRKHNGGLISDGIGGGGRVERKHNGGLSSDGIEGGGRVERKHNGGLISDGIDGGSRTERKHNGGLISDGIEGGGRVERKHNGGLISDGIEGGGRVERKHNGGLISDSIEDGSRTERKHNGGFISDGFEGGGRTERKHNGGLISDGFEDGIRTEHRYFCAHCDYSQARKELLENHIKNTHLTSLMNAVEAVSSTTVENDYGGFPYPFPSYAIRGMTSTNNYESFSLKRDRYSSISEDSSFGLQAGNTNTCAVLQETQPARYFYENFKRDLFPCSLSLAESYYKSSRGELDRKWPECQETLVNITNEVSTLRVKPLLSLTEEDDQLKGINDDRERPFKCTICPADYISKHHLKAHVVRVHERSPLKCKTCSAEFPSKYILKQHELKIHIRPSLKCTTCSTNFSSKYHLNRHIFHKHWTQPCIHCKLCWLTFPTSSELEIHSKQKHEKWHKRRDLLRQKSNAYNFINCPETPLKKDIPSSPNESAREVDVVSISDDEVAEIWRSAVKNPLSSSLSDIAISTEKNRDSVEVQTQNACGDIKSGRQSKSEEACDVSLIEISDDEEEEESTIDEQDTIVARYGWDYQTNDIGKEAETIGNSVKSNDTSCTEENVHSGSYNNHKPRVKQPKSKEEQFQWPQFHIQKNPSSLASNIASDKSNNQRIVDLYNAMKFQRLRVENKKIAEFEIWDTESETSFSETEDGL